MDRLLGDYLTLHTDVLQEVDLSVLPHPSLNHETRITFHGATAYFNAEWQLSWIPQRGRLGTTKDQLIATGTAPVFKP
jgi:hypothetical protein